MCLSLIPINRWEAFLEAIRLPVHSILTNDLLCTCVIALRIYHQPMAMLPNMAIFRSPTLYCTYDVGI